MKKLTNKSSNEYDTKWYGSLWDNLKVSKEKWVKGKSMFFFKIGVERTQLTEKQALVLAMFLLSNVISPMSEPGHYKINEEGKIID